MTRRDARVSNSANQPSRVSVRDDATRRRRRHVGPSRWLRTDHGTGQGHVATRSVSTSTLTAARDGDGSSVRGWLGASRSRRRRWRRRRRWYSHSTTMLGKAVSIDRSFADATVRARYARGDEINGIDEIDRFCHTSTAV